jgi:hypothetical protein
MKVLGTVTGRFSSRPNLTTREPTEALIEEAMRIKPHWAGKIGAPILSRPKLVT